MIRSLHLIFTEMEVGKFVPKDWNSMIIKSVHKKGPLQDMNKKRGLFLTNVISKIYEKVLKKRNKPIIDNSVSESQVGGKKQRGTSDLLILLSDLIRRNRIMGRRTYLVFGDAIKCFDKLWLRDCLVEMYKMGRYIGYITRKIRNCQTERKIEAVPSKSLEPKVYRT